MMKTHSSYKYFFLYSLLLLMGSCKKFLEVDPPVNQVTTGMVFQSDQSATAAMTGLYSRMMGSLYTWSNGGLSIYSGLSADEYLPTQPDMERDEFSSNALSPQNGIVQGQFWVAAYNHIYQANAVLAGLDQSAAVSAAVKKRLTGEAFFNRALCYFYLINLFGEVPLVTTTDYRVSAGMARTAVPEIYGQIVSDLQAATELLAEGNSTPDRTRPGKVAATALLSRVYLYRQEWDKAEAAASTVLDGGGYQLESLENVFRAESREAIWQLAPVTSSYNTTEGFAFLPYPATARPAYALTAQLLSAFQSGDQRATAWVGSSTVEGKTYYYPAKYKVKFSFLSNQKEYNMVLRLAEQYLVRAEAAAWQDKEEQALADLNTIRRRAGLADTALSGREALLKAIAVERQRELFAEWGHRWLDLKRTGRLQAVLAPLKAGWQPTDALYPIPHSELQTNPALVQNAGY